MSSNLHPFRFSPTACFRQGCGLVACVLLGFAAPAQAESLQRALLLRPDDGMHPFWKSFAAATQAACRDFEVKFESLEASWDQLAMADQLEKRLQTAPKPDVVLFQSFKKNGPKLIKLLEQYQTKGFLINAGMDNEQQAEIGQPREKYSFWIGQMLPDDVAAGKATAELLYQRAKGKGLFKAGKVAAFAIAGNTADGASIARVKGLRDFADSHADLQLLQVVPGRWEFNYAYDVTRTLLGRYSEASIVWAAGDSTALGAIKALKEAGKVPGKQVVTAGVDWAPEALAAIKAGELEGSAGGHFMEGAWAIVVLYDYFKGIDFAGKEGVLLSSQMGLITQENLSNFEAKFGTGDWQKIDYKKLSKALNPSRERYSFDLTEFLK